MSSRGRIGIYLSGRQLGSRERLFLAVAEALRDRDWSVSLLAAGPEQALQDARPAGTALTDLAPARAQQMGVPHVMRIALGVGKLARWAERERPALLFGTSIPPNLAVLRAAQQAGSGVPVVLRQSNTLHIPEHPRYAGIRRRMRDPLVARLYPEATRIIAVAEEVADNLCALGAAERDAIRVIPNAVAVGEARARAEEAAEHPWFREDDDTPRVVTAGRLVRKKDHLTLLDAFARVVQERPARLIVFGEGPMRRALEQRIAELGLGDAVSLPGHTDNPFAAMARADLFVLSSISEGMPSVLIEALACQTPVVSTDCPSGPREILGDEPSVGSLVPVGHPEALAQAMLAQLASPKDADALAERAKRFTLEAVVPRYVAVLEEAAGLSAP